MTNIIYEDIRKVKTTANGWYEPQTDTIHVIEGAHLELRTLFHETAHAKRRNKLTFQLGSLTATPLYQTVLFAMIMLTGFLATFTYIFYPFLLLASLYLFCYACWNYEENIANREMNKRIREVLQ